MFDTLIKSAPRRPSVWAVICFSVAVGVEAGFFCIASAVFRPFIGASHSSLFVIGLSSRGETYETLSWGEFSSFREATSAAESVAAEGMSLPTLVFRSDGYERVVDGRVVSANFMNALGFTPHYGRDFTRSDEDSADLAAVISYDLWERTGAEPSLVGKVIHVSGQPARVIGIAPRKMWGTSLGHRDDIWLSLNAATLLGGWQPSQLFANPQIRTVAQFRWLVVHTRIRPDNISAARAQAERAVGSTQWIPSDVAAYPRQFRVSMKRLMRLLSGMAALVFFVCVVNIAGFELTRVMTRAMDLQTRRMLGATSRDIFIVLASASWSLCWRGTLGGIALTIGIIQLLQSVSLPGSVLIAGLPIRVEGSTVAFGAVVVLSLAFVSAIVPTVYGIRASGDRAGIPARGMSPRIRALHTVLLAPQVTLAIVSSAAAVLLFANLHRALSADLGFARERAVFFSVRSADFRRWAPDAKTLAATQISEVLPDVPGVSNGAYGRTLFGPDIGLTGWNLAVEGRQQLTREPYLVRSVGSGFLEALGIRPIAGRTITSQDVHGTPAVAVVSRGFAIQFWRSPSDAVGMSLSLPSEGQVQIIGVVSDVVREGLGGTSRPTVFVPALQHPSTFSSLDFVVSSDSSAREILPRVQGAITSVLPDAQLTNVRTPEQLIGNQVSDERLALQVAAILGMITVALSSAGLFALVRLMIRDRHFEIGIRIALGATPSAIRRQFASYGAAAIAAGSIVAAASWGPVNAFLAPFLIGSYRLSSGAILGAGILVVTFATGACLWASSTATRVNPSTLLRQT